MLMGRKESNQTKQVSQVVFELYTFFMGGFRGGGGGGGGGGTEAVGPDPQLL